MPSVNLGLKKSGAEGATPPESLRYKESLVDDNLESSLIYASEDPRLLNSPKGKNRRLPGKT